VSNTIRSSGELLDCIENPRFHGAHLFLGFVLLPQGAVHHLGSNDVHDVRVKISSCVSKTVHCQMVCITLVSFVLVCDKMSQHVAWATVSCVTVYAFHVPSRVIDTTLEADLRNNHLPSSHTANSVSLWLNRVLRPDKEVLS
jgi:hypothetical protein